MDYFKDTVDKTVTGFPAELIFDNELVHKIYLNPWPNESLSLHYLAEIKLEDFDTASNDPNFGSNCLAFLIWELSYRISFKHSVPDSDKNRFRQEAMAAWNRLKKKDKPSDDKIYIGSAYG